MTTSMNNPGLGATMAALGLAAVSGIAATTPAGRPPNILLLVSDQHRWSALGCYGNPAVHSPNFDRMAAEGVRFTRCLSSCPVCAPFRATLQTGLHAHQHNVRGNQAPWVGAHLPSLADAFNAANYETAFVGKSHWGRYLFYDLPWIGGYVPPERRLRWKTWCSTAGHEQYGCAVRGADGKPIRDAGDTPQPEFQTGLALECIEAAGESPWLVQLNWGPPHTMNWRPGEPSDEVFCDRAKVLNKELEFNLPDEVFQPSRLKEMRLLMPQYLLRQVVPQEYLDRYRLEDLEVDPNVPEQFRNVARHHYREYYAMVSQLDDQLGRILDHLRATGRDKNTLVVYTSDHGDRIAAHCTLQKFRTKSSHHQNSVRVPLLVWGPGVGVRAGVVNDTPVGSVDLLPTLLALAGRPVPPQLPGEALAAAFTGAEPSRDRLVLMSLDPWRAVYDGRFLYAVRGLETSWEALSLIDTVADPYDLHNLLESPAFAADRERLHASLVRELIRTSDHEFVLRTQLKERHLPSPGTDTGGE